MDEYVKIWCPKCGTEFKISNSRSVEDGIVKLEYEESIMRVQMMAEQIRALKMENKELKILLESYRKSMKRHTDVFGI